MYDMEVMVTGWQRVQYEKKDGKKVDGYRVYGRTMNDMRKVDTAGNVLEDGYFCAEWWSSVPVEVGSRCHLRKGKYGWYAS